MKWGCIANKTEERSVNGKVIQFDQAPTTSIKSLLRRYVWSLLAPFFTPLGSALFGALIYGAWTFAVNVSSGGYFIALRSGLIHAAMSFSITYGSVLLMRAVFKRASTPRQGAILAPLITLSLTYLLLIGVHLYIGTPHIVWTLSPGLLLNIGYDTIYSVILYREATLNAQTTSNPTSHSISGDYP
jgi:hypothetical protein